MGTAALNDASSEFAEAVGDLIVSVRNRWSVCTFAQVKPDWQGRCIRHVPTRTKVLFAPQ